MTPEQVLLSLFLSNPQPIGLPDLAAGCIEALRLAGFKIERETADAE